MSTPASSHDLVDIIERLPDSESEVRVIVKGVDYDLGVATVRYLGRPSLQLVYVRTGRVAPWVMAPPRIASNLGEAK